MIKICKRNKKKYQQLKQLILNYNLNMINKKNNLLCQKIYKKMFKMKEKKK